MTEATERERRRDTDEAETNVQYSEETVNGETRDREAYDRDVDDVGGAEGSRSDGADSYRGPDEAQTRAEQTEQELADRDQTRSDLHATGLDRTEAERAGVDGSEADRSDVHASDLAQPGTATADPGYRNRSGYDAVASQDPMVSQPDGVSQPDRGSVSVVDASDALMRRWQEVQTGFVDDPRQAVQEADGLVQQVMQQVGQRLASERAGLEQVWSRGGDVSTEDLRQALRQYRSFFNRLLHV